MESISFLSWNMAMLARSDEAPASWRQENTEAAFRDFVLELDPDIVLLQELPGLVPFVETHGMVRANPLSHNGNLATLVRHELLAAEPTVAVVPGCAILTTFEQSLTVANVHLRSGAGATGERLEQIAAVVEASPTPRIAIIGDTNTRLNEKQAFADADLIGEKPPQPTWNSKRNRFNADGPQFTAYFTRWFTSPGVAIEKPTVHNEPMKLEGYTFHLSDHFPLSGSIVSQA